MWSDLMKLDITPVVEDDDLNARLPDCRQVVRRPDSMQLMRRPAAELRNA
ncbi:hypothetical protein PTKU46_94210 [Paraburkholderia terrae]